METTNLYNDKRYTDNLYTEIEGLVLNYFNLFRYELYSKSRKANIVDGRRTMMYLLKERYNLTYSEIGRIFSVDHATAIYHCRTMQYMKDQEPIKSKLDAIYECLDVDNIRVKYPSIKEIMNCIVDNEPGTTRQNLERILPIVL